MMDNSVQAKVRSEPVPPLRTTLDPLHRAVPHRTSALAIRQAL